MRPLIFRPSHATAGCGHRTRRRPTDVGAPPTDPIAFRVFTMPVVRELPSLPADPSDDLGW